MNSFTFFHTHDTYAVECMYEKTHYFCQTALSSRHEWEKNDKRAEKSSSCRRETEEATKKCWKETNNKKETKISLSCLITQQRPGELCVEHGSRASNSNLLKKKRQATRHLTQNFYFLCCVIVFIAVCTLVVCFPIDFVARSLARRRWCMAGSWDTAESREWADNDDVFFFGRKRMLFTHFSFHLVVVSFLSFA